MAPDRGTAVADVLITQLAAPAHVGYVPIQGRHQYGAPPQPRLDLAAAGTTVARIQCLDAVACQSASAR